MVATNVSLIEEVYRAINEEWSRIEEIAHRADLSVVTTKKHVSTLFASNKIIRNPVKAGKRGRPAFVYRLPEAK